MEWYVVWIFILFASTGFTLLYGWMSVMAFRGTLADVGPEESRMMGFLFLGFALAPWVLVGMVVVLKKVLKRRGRH